MTKHLRLAGFVAFALALLAGTTGAAASEPQVPSAFIGNDAPSWSPDGKRIAFVSFQHGRFGDVYAMDADGRHRTRLTTTPEHEDTPRWSPDGGRIAYVGVRDHVFQIFVMNADGSDQTQLTHTAGSNFGPAWSPDGSRIVFGSSRDGNWEIYVMNADGSDPTRLTDDPNADVLPDWSPDGRLIVFASSRGRLAQQAFVMRPDGSEVRRLTRDPLTWHPEMRPVWSPDGSKVAFVTDRDPPVGNTELYTVDADGSNEQRVTHNDLRDDWPSWSPDGKSLVFSRGFDLFRPEIFVKTLDGGATRKLTGTTLHFVRLFRSPAVPQSGARFTVDLAVRPTLDRDADLICVALIGKKVLPLEFGDIVGGRVRCRWAVPTSARGKEAHVGVSAQKGGSEIVRTFAVRVR